VQIFRWRNRDIHIEISTGAASIPIFEYELLLLYLKR
jgi:hypothetical protein